MSFRFCHAGRQRGKGWTKRWIQGFHVYLWWAQTPVVVLNVLKLSLQPILIFSFLVHAVLLALDNMGFVANMASLVLYFYGVMHFDLSNSANTLTNFLGSTFLLSLVGGFISDTYFNRLTTCLFFGSLEVLVSAKQ